MSSRPSGSSANRSSGVHVGPALLALRFAFRVRSTSRAVRDHLVHLFGALPAAGSGVVHEYAILERRGVGGERWLLYLDGRRLAHSREPWHAVSLLLADLNSRGLRSVASETVLHAAGAVLGGRAVVLPGPSGAGKSTLVTRLVLDGFAYLTDEAVILPEQAEGLVPAYPKPVALAIPSQELFPTIARVAAPPEPSLRGRQLLVAPDDIRPGSVAPPAPVGAFVLARWEPSGGTSVRRFDAAHAVVALAANCLTFGGRPRAALATLAALVEALPVYGLHLGPGTDPGSVLSDLLERRRVRE